MTQQTRDVHTILRRRQVEAATGFSRSTLYLRIAQGMWPMPVRIGPRAVGWPANEVAAMNAARIAGLSDSEIRTVVAELQNDRRLLPVRSDLNHVEA
jgi:prophage regulatory protein